jgi:hypothetical protein
LLSLFGFKLYLHHFVGNDWTKDLHDHPKWFVSFGLKGGYEEEYASLVKGCAPYTTDRYVKLFRVWRAPWVRYFPALHRHRLQVKGKDCWTLVLVGRPKRKWGFWNQGKWVFWKEYLKTPFADERKDC